MTSAARPGSVEFIGNATALIRYGPFTLLTDPNFLHRGQRAYLGYGLVSKRLHAPARQLSTLPDLDAVVLSHLHGDHWDRVARKGLDRGLPVLTTPHASRRLQGRAGFRRALGLRTWEGHTLHKDGQTLRVTAMPGRHAFGVLGALLPPVMGSLLEFGDARGSVDYRLYITGDTLVFDGLREISRRYPDIDLGVLHLGGTKLGAPKLGAPKLGATKLSSGFLVTMDGDQGAELLDIVRPRRAIPVHVDDYSLFTSPLSDFTNAVERRGLGVRVTALERGEQTGIGPGD